MKDQYNLKTLIVHARFTEISSCCSVELGKAAGSFKEPDVEVEGSSVADSIESFVTDCATATL